MRYSRKDNKGFTLVELLVAIGVFSIIMTLAAGAYLIMIDLNQRAQAIALTSNSLSFVFENMTRAIRTGTNYSCGGGGDCISGGSVFSFTDPQGRAIIYTFIPPTQNTNGYIEQSIDGDAFQLTDPTINVTQLSFYLTGSPDGSLDYEQPFVRMTVAGTAAAGPDAEFSFSIETAAAMRGIDI